MRDKEAIDRIKVASATLSEHFDHVQIMVTWDESNVTKHGFWGGGNWYARLGLAKYFLDHDNAQEMAMELSGVMEAE